MILLTGLFSDFLAKIPICKLLVVAGTGFEPVTFGL